MVRSEQIFILVRMGSLRCILWHSISNLVDLVLCELRHVDILTLFGGCLTSDSAWLGFPDLSVSELLR